MRYLSSISNPNPRDVVARDVVKLHPGWCTILLDALLPPVFMPLAPLSDGKGIRENAAGFESLEFRGIHLLRFITPGSPLSKVLSPLVTAMLHLVCKFVSPMLNNTQAWPFGQAGKRKVRCFALRA
jgi:hypothetical protein